MIHNEQAELTVRFDTSSTISDMIFSSNQNTTYSTSFKMGNYTVFNFMLSNLHIISFPKYLYEPHRKTVIFLILY